MPPPSDQPPPVQPQFYPIHPEFGYLVPAPPFRRKAWLIVKAAVFGAAAGALAVMALLPDRDLALFEPRLVLEAAASPASPQKTPSLSKVAISATTAPEGFSVPVTAAESTLPAAATALLLAGAMAVAKINDAAAKPARAPVQSPTAAPAPKSTKKQVARPRSPKPRQAKSRPAEPEARSAYASSYGHTFGRTVEQPRRESGGWQGGFGQRGFRW